MISKPYLRQLSGAHIIFLLFSATYSLFLSSAFSQELDQSEIDSLLLLTGLREFDQMTQTFSLLDPSQTKPKSCADGPDLSPEPESEQWIDAICLEGETEGENAKNTEPSPAVQRWEVSAFTRADTIPQPFRDTLAHPARVSKERPYYILMGLSNDDWLMGVWGLMGGEDGDDRGYTHGFELEAGGLSKRGLMHRLRLNSDLITSLRQDSRMVKDSNGNQLYKTPDGQTVYVVSEETRDVPCRIGPPNCTTGVIYRTTSNGQVYLANELSAVQDPRTPINFSERSALTYRVDNLQQRQPIFWIAEAGLQLSNSSKITPLASGTQKVWHQLLGDNAPQYKYVSSGEKIRLGGLLRGVVGLQQTVNGGGRCALRTYQSVGAQVSTLPRASQVDFGLGVSADYRFKRSTLSAQLHGKWVVDPTQNYGLIAPTVTYDRKRVTYFMSLDSFTPITDTESGLPYGRASINRFGVIFYPGQKRKTN